MTPRQTTPPQQTTSPRVLDGNAWRDAVYALAAIDRPSASEGEREAAEWIASRLRNLGWPTRIEEEQAHGGYWWPLAVANAIGAAGGVLALTGRNRIRRAVGALAGAAAAAAAWDDVTGRGFRYRHALFPRQSTWNVVAEAGDPSALETVIVVAHHDAAHSGLVFHPGLGQIGPKLLPRLHARARHTVPILHAVWGGPLMVLAGALLRSPRLLRGGTALALGAIAAMVDIGLRPVVPGANDNLSAVAALLAVGQSLRDEPLDGLRVLLVSTGSEESFSEGMQGFADRHFPGLRPDHTSVLCLECLGGSTMIVLEGEGMLRIQDYPAEMRDELAAAAAEAGVPITRGLRTVAATDGLISMRAGYPTVTLASVEDTKLPLNYHWPSDTPEALHWDTIEGAVAVSDRFLRRRAASG